MTYQSPNNYRLDAAGVIVVGAVLTLLAQPVAPSVALAQQQPGPAAYATVHALEEQANACAQHKPECWTPTPTATATPTTTSTPRPTDIPTPESTRVSNLPTPEVEPCWLTDQDLGDPDNGWIVFDGDGRPIPCPSDVDQVDELTPEPTATPRPTATLRPAAAPVAPQIVVQTVVVVVTATPVDAASPRPTARPVVVVIEPAATQRPEPTAISVSSSIPAAAVVEPTSSPTVMSTPEALEVAGMQSPGGEDRHWLYVSVALCAGLVAVAALWLIRRGRRAYAP